jgi:Fur family ferric uptake transcriptional regulator
MTEIVEKLKTHNIRATCIRKAILSIFCKMEFALSRSDIENQLPENFDRVTTYRTLNTFLSNGLIHRVADGSGVIKFALCDSERCDFEIHRDEHIHFKCRLCGHTFCITPYNLIPPNLPGGYIIKSFSTSAEGICKDCSDKS